MKLRVQDKVIELQRSSNGKAINEVNPISRRISVTPIYARFMFKPYLSVGCGSVQCHFPKITCDKCPIKITQNNEYKND